MWGVCLRSANLRISQLSAREKGAISSHYASTCLNTFGRLGEIAGLRDVSISALFKRTISCECRVRRGPVACPGRCDRMLHLGAPADLDARRRDGVCSTATILGSVGACYGAISADSASAGASGVRGAVPENRKPPLTRSEAASRIGVADGTRTPVRQSNSGFCILQKMTPNCALRACVDCLRRSSIGPGRLAIVRIGRTPYIARSELHSYIARRRETGAAAQRPRRQRGAA